MLLDTISPALARPLSRADVRGQFAGLRPLLDTGNGATSDLSRDHAVLIARGKPITVVGGKLTTYRKMAQDAIDAAVSRAGLRAGPCATESLALVADQVRKTASDERIAEGIDITRAEVEFALTHEGALDVDDILHRRTRIGLVPEEARRARGAVEAIVAEVRSRLDR